MADTNTRQEKKPNIIERLLFGPNANKGLIVLDKKGVDSFDFTPTGISASWGPNSGYNFSSNYGGTINYMVAAGDLIDNSVLYVLVVVLSILPSRAAFSNHIRAILSSSAKPQMSRVTTQRVIPAGAVMQYPHPLGYRAVSQLIGYTVRKVTDILDCYFGVPCLLRVPALPQPTRVVAAAFIQLACKAFSNRFGFGITRTRVRAIVTLLPILAHEYFATYRASSLGCSNTAFVSAISRTVVTWTRRRAHKCFAASRTSALSASVLACACYNLHVIGLLNRLIIEPGVLQASPGFTR